MSVTNWATIAVAALLMVSSEGTPLISKGRSGALRAVVAAALLKSSRSEAALQRLLLLLWLKYLSGIWILTLFILASRKTSWALWGWKDTKGNLKRERRRSEVLSGYAASHLYLAMQQQSRGAYLRVGGRRQTFRHVIKQVFFLSTNSIVKLSV